MRIATSVRVDLSNHADSHASRSLTTPTAVFRSPRSPNLDPAVRGISSLSRAHNRPSSTFLGRPFGISAPRSTHIVGGSNASAPVTMMARPVIQFIQGTDEQTIPDVKLTKSRDGTNGVATFIFKEPSVFDSSKELGDITGPFMIDEEGILQSTNVTAKFLNGKPSAIEAKYIMRIPRDWDRFMRFMERYSNANGLQFIKK
ncbi:hypothetical protein KSP40_PGU013622 [Platanthera guangdongensis]|uniref:Photosystem II reaction center Psb28 protein n=1 Tax=Platanthera guangdongensis TaxID=2320717 RepID=A0ABR2LRU4_9ASPA